MLFAIFIPNNISYTSSRSCKFTLVKFTRTFPLS
nr:MAG TPA: hypothetical protein [Caudoviricetes sp.]